MIKRTARQTVRAAVDSLEPRRLFATVVGLTADDELVTFDTATPGTVSAPVDVTGLGASETLVGIDYRPATGQLFGLGSTGQLYTLNRTTGAATAVGSTPFTLTGASFGVDFNPQVDRLRVVSEADQNVRVDPATGAQVTPADTNLAYATGDENEGDNPNVVGAAYDNNVASTGATTLYVIDSTANTLATQGSAAGATTPVSPNTGQLFTVGALGVDVGDVGGFDVAESDGAAYAALAPAGGGGSTLYTVNLTTGAATAVAAVANNLTLKGLTAVPVERRLFALASSGTAFARLSTGNLAANPTLTDITGLAAGTTLTSIDFRPATGQLFGATAGGQLYTIDPATGAATAAGAGLTPTLPGNITDIDFNPTVDRIRVITDADANARANPDTGELVDANTGTDGVQADTNLAYDDDDAGNGTDPNVVGAGYTNSAQGATATTLYGLDAARDVLVSIGSVEGELLPTVSPNTGQLFSIGALGIDVESGGLDIANDGPAFALVNVAGGTGSQLYTVNTTTGAATLIGTVGDGTQTFADVAVGNSVFSVFPATQNAAEGSGNVTITVNRNGVAEGPATVGYELVTPTGAGVNPATAGTDFGTAGTTTFAGTVSFADGETSQTITVPLINDSADEDDETFIVGLTNASGAGLGSSVQATVVITDDDGDGVQPASVVLATDPVRTTGRATQTLTVNGTGGDDVIVVQQSGPNVVVTLNGTAIGDPAPVRGLYRVVVFGRAGDDQVRLNSRLKFSGELHGEGGDDLLVGSRGRDLLVGGEGVDALYGRAGDDILIGGASDYTANPTATASLLNVFLGRGNFATRANGVSTGAGVNSFVFSAETIDDDDDRDFLAGEGKTDLYLTKANDIVVDEAIGGGVVRTV